MNSAMVLSAAQWFLRIALAAGFLSAVADRFGLWGPAGAANVAWGSWQPFVDYVAKLNWFAPTASIPILAWVSTAAEVVIGIGLLIGWQLRWFALAAGLLLLSFAITMTLALGVKAPLDFSVFAAAGGRFCWLPALIRPNQAMQPTASPRTASPFDG
jgi:uncharacterized membrane protein YphA (DoxX/SURF4 family)